MFVRVDKDRFTCSLFSNHLLLTIHIYFGHSLILSRNEKPTQNDKTPILEAVCSLAYLPPVSCGCDVRLCSAVFVRDTRCSPARVGVSVAWRNDLGSPVFDYSNCMRRIAFLNYGNSRWNSMKTRAEIFSNVERNRCRKLVG